MLCPHEAQNLAVGRFFARQAEQVGSAVAGAVFAPHSGQNLAPTERENPQEHFDISSCLLFNRF